MLTASLYILVEYLNINATGWIYVLPVFTDIAIIGKFIDGN